MTQVITRFSIYSPMKNTSVVISFNKGGGRYWTIQEACPGQFTEVSVPCEESVLDGIRCASFSTVYRMDSSDDMSWFVLVFHSPLEHDMLGIPCNHVVSQPNFSAILITTVIYTAILYYTHRELFNMHTTNGRFKVVNYVLLSFHRPLYFSIFW